MSKISIKPSKKGTLRKAMGAKKGKNLSVSAMNSRLHSKGTTPAMKKKLVFALNARKWKKEDGGLVESMEGGGFVWDGLSKPQTGSIAGVGALVGGAITGIDGMDGKTSIGGQVAGGAISGAAAGMALGPIGAAVGGALGAGVGAIKGIINKRQYEEEAEANAAFKAAGIQSAQIASNQSGMGNVPTFAKGGVVYGKDLHHRPIRKYNIGGLIPDAIPNIEVEKKEVALAKDGSMVTFDLPSHKNATAANQVAMEPGTRIFSDKIKTKDGRTIAEQADELRQKIEQYEQLLYT